MFGHKQRGRAALNATNIFFPLTYDYYFLGMLNDPNSEYDLAYKSALIE